jgi:2-polyprenyl-3-methyl-5-hydroxy-6-metoxy-1,4-benzoquinol methylase
MSLRWQLAQFFEIRWWQNYLKNKDKSTYLDWKRDYWQRFLQKSGIVLLPNSRILDAGCGPAGIFTILDAHQTDALDPLLEDYEAKLPQFVRGDYPSVNFICESLENFKETKPYDAIFCLNAINHVADLEACLNHLTELTKPNGVLAMSIDAHNFSFLKRLFRLVPGDILHPHQYDLQEYEAMMTSRGFQLTQSVLIKHELIFDYYLLVGRLGK